MKRMSASKFKTRCLSVIRSVQLTGEPVVITKRGKPHVKIVRVDPDTESIFGSMAGKFKIAGDIEAPAGEWKTEEQFFPRRCARR